MLGEGEEVGCWKELIFPLHILLCVLVRTAASLYARPVRLCLNNHGVRKHLWKMKITSLEDAMNPPRDRIARFYGSDSEDEDEDEGEGRFSRSVILFPLEEEHEWAAEDGDFSEDSRTRMVSSNDKLSREFLPMGSIVEVTYDYGTPTTLYLKEATTSDLAPCFGEKVIGCTSLGLSGPHTFCAMEQYPKPGSIIRPCHV